jgi:hypothetical protein
MLRQYASEYSASHLTWSDFADDARAILEATAPALADAVVQKITAHKHAYEPEGPLIGGETAQDQRRRAWRRHFSIAAQVAAGAFSTREDQLREAAQAIAAGNYTACHTREENDNA